MAVQKKNKKPARKQSAAANPSKQIAALRAEVKALRAKLERESHMGQINIRLLSEAKKASAELTRQITTLRSQGKKLATQLKTTLGDSKHRDRARKEALARVADLRKELGLRTDELRRKSDELRRLAQESAHRAVEIIRGEPQPSAPPSAPDVGEEPGEFEPHN